MDFGDNKLQSIWYNQELDCVDIIDQTRLPVHFEIISLKSLEDACHAISAMQVRGAPLIGVTAAYGVYLGLREGGLSLAQVIDSLAATRPTAVNLHWALSRVRQELSDYPERERVPMALALARRMEAEDAAICEAIGDHGADLLAQRFANNPVINILTHCNAGALAAVDWGTALAVIFKLAERGREVHVWVDETRPRNQGASLTCWELQQRRIAHTLVVDNAGGLLMQQGQVDVCLVGSDRTTCNGDVCNKIGTYLKALAAHDNGIPFYVALPVSTIDFNLDDGGDIPIELRSEQEITEITGRDVAGNACSVSIASPGVRAHNPAFDITPARFVTALITEKGVVAASRDGIASLRSGS